MRWSTISCPETEFCRFSRGNPVLRNEVRDSQKRYTHTNTEFEFKSETKPHTAADVAVQERPAKSASSPTTNPYKP